MSFDPDNPDSERSVYQQNEEIIHLLKALVRGVEIITDNECLADQAED